MNALLLLFSNVVQFYMWIVIAYVVLGWLITFNIVNIHTPAVASLSNILRQLVEPALRPIRNLLARFGFANLGGIDISPVILLFALYFAHNLIRLDIIPALAG